MNFFSRVRIAWLTIRFLNAYGPDAAKLIVRDLPFEDMCRVAIRNWNDEGFHLLPIRYQRIMKALVEEGHLSEADYNRRMHGVFMVTETKVFIIENGTSVECTPEELQNPWDDPVLVPRLSATLLKKIREYEADSDVFVGSSEAAIHWVLTLGEKLS